MGAEVVMGRSSFVTPALRQGPASSTLAKAAGPRVKPGVTE